MIFIIALIFIYGDNNSYIWLNISYSLFRKLMKKRMITYVNSTEGYQIIAIRDVRCPLEKTVYPHSEITFEMFPETLCEITEGSVTSLIPEQIPCVQLSNEV